MNDKGMHFKRKETTYDGAETNTPVTVLILSECGEDEDGEPLWRVRLPESGKAVIVPQCDLSPSPDAPLTNDEFMALVMDWSKNGALMQAFVLQGVEQFAKLIASKTPEELDSGFVSGAAWRDCALEVLGWYAARDFDEQERRGELTPAG